MVQTAGALCVLVFCFQAVLAASPGWEERQRLPHLEGPLSSKDLVNRTVPLIVLFKTTVEVKKHNSEEELKTLKTKEQPSDSSFPPEDQDSSGDDEDPFSGSGDEVSSSVVPAISKGESTNTSLIPAVSTDVGDNQPEVLGTHSPVEDYTRVSVPPMSTTLFPLIDLMPEKPVVAVEEDGLNSFAQQATTRSTVKTTGVPVIDHPDSTVRVTSAHASSSGGVIEPEDIHNKHYLSHAEEQSPAFVPTSERSPGISSHTTASTAASTAASTTVSTTASTSVYEESSSQPENVLISEDGSGAEGDFVFTILDETPVIRDESESRNAELDSGAQDSKSEGAPQGIMDRKEVLGGVIAGGLVGLLFAVSLVVFMLYRMKKKDEGSYSLDEPKQSNGGYQKPHKQEEFYA
ncbi:Syndecan-1 [Varanus komodoensis]|nr:Syndecan-1 [Varanus komodoensis]